MRDILIYFAHKYLGDWDKIYDALEEKEEVNWSEVQKINKRYDRTISILDEDYPSELKKIVKPPFVLFYKGNKSLLKTKNIIWTYGSYINEDFVKLPLEIKTEMDDNEIITLTGHSDSYENYLVNNILLNIIVVKDCGIKSRLILTRELEDKIINDSGLIISEYPSHVIPSLKTWDDSNRLKIGLSKGIFLINSLKEKTTFRLIRETLEEGKEVYALNMYTDNKTHNSMLISKGAYPVNKIKELKK